jgi:dihydrodipicolinate synthase/N-acetylneuraminate lyase
VTVGDMVTDGSADAELAAFVAEMSTRVPVRLAGGVDWLGRMEMGVFGFHSIQQSIAPRHCSRMMEAFHAGDLEVARDYAERIRSLNLVVHDQRYAYPRSLKPILEHLGFAVGAIRRPYLPLPEAVRAELCARVDELELWRIEDVPAVHRT